MIRVFVRTAVGFGFLSSLLGAEPIWHVSAQSPPFDIAAISMEPKLRDAVIDGCTVLSHNIVVSNRVRAQMIAVTLYCDPQNDLAKKGNTAMKNGKAPTPLKLSDEDPTLDERAIALVDATQAIYEGAASKNTDTLSFVAMLHDISFAIYPRDPEVIYARRVFLKNHPPADWDKILQSSSTPAAAGVAMKAADGALAFKIRQAGVNGLLIRELPGGAMAGKASRMSATFLDQEDVQGFHRMRFNQEVGPMMRDTLHGVAKLMNDRHDGWIETGMIEIAFQEKFVPKDGDSAGLATGLMVESLVTGAPIDPGFTCTGALKGDGTVAPIGGVVAKLRGAQKFGSRLVALPSENRYALTDLTVLGQAAVLAKMQVFIVEDFDEAWGLAKQDRSADVQASIDQFAQLQGLFAQQGVMNVLRSPGGRQGLNDVLERTPNHASARLMMSVVDGKMPARLSINGTLEEFSTEMFEVMSRVQKPPRLAPTQNSTIREFQLINKRLRALGKRAHKDTTDVVQSLLELSEELITYKTRVGDRRPQIQGQYNPVESLRVKLISLDSELKQIARHPELLEDVE